MLLIIRAIITILFGIAVSIAGIIYCLLTPRNLNHVSRVAKWFLYLASIYGIRVISRSSSTQPLPQQAVFIANHQNNYDLVTAAGMVQPSTVTIGKKSLRWVPLWGQLYWLSGNILIDRNDRSKAHKTIQFVVDKMKSRPISVWMFPEGTRSRGRGLLPFKTGAFRTAIEAGVPIVPICVSNTCNGKINLNRLKNGYVIVEMLDPIDIAPYIAMDNLKEASRKLAEHCHAVMQEKITQLDLEVAALEAAEFEATKTEADKIENINKK